MTFEYARNNTNIDIAQFQSVLTFQISGWQPQKVYRACIRYPLSYVEITNLNVECQAVQLHNSPSTSDCMLLNNYLFFSVFVFLLLVCWWRRPRKLIHQESKLLRVTYKISPNKSAIRLPKRFLHQVTTSIILIIFTTRQGECQLTIVMRSITFDS